MSVGAVRLSLALTQNCGEKDCFYRLDGKTIRLHITYFMTENET